MSAHALQVLVQRMWCCVAARTQQGAAPYLGSDTQGSSRAFLYQQILPRVHVTHEHSVANPAAALLVSYMSLAQFCRGPPPRRLLGYSSGRPRARPWKIGGDDIRAGPTRKSDCQLQKTGICKKHKQANGLPMTRTVNGTGHTGPSEFCATSI